MDIIFNFEKAYFILDEFMMGGEILETSKSSVARAIEASDMLQEVSIMGWHRCPHLFTIIHTNPFKWNFLISVVVCYSASTQRLIRDQVVSVLMKKYNR